MDWPGKPTVEDAVNDVMRQQYLHDHIEAVGEALLAGVNIKGYFIWSFQVRLFNSLIVILSLG